MVSASCRSRTKFRYKQTGYIGHIEDQSTAFDEPEKAKMADCQAIHLRSNELDRARSLSYAMAVSSSNRTRIEADHQAKNETRTNLSSFKRIAHGTEKEEPSNARQRRVSGIWIPQGDRQTIRHKQIILMSQ